VDTTTPTNLRLNGLGGPDGCTYTDLNQADGSLTSGLWLALGQFGVDAIMPGPQAQK
jgi:hypothetical protein